MNARNWICLAILTQLLVGCESVNQSDLAVSAVENTRAQRIVYIKKVISRACPTPLKDDELERAAQFVLDHRDNKEAVWVTGRLEKMDAEVRICRGKR
jgi:hypothetical protein